MNLEQIRAQHAYEAAAANPTDSYLTLARSLPQMFQTNGLLATWAFLLAKDKTEHRAVLRALVGHLQKRGLVRSQSIDARDLLISEWTGHEHHLSTEELQDMTTEALAFAGWIKRAAEALCDQGGTTP